MSLLVAYVIFALTTALTAILELLYPVVHKCETDTDSILPKKYILYATFFAFSVVLAPVIFFSCIVPSMNARFRDSLYNGLFSKD